MSNGITRTVSAERFKARRRKTTWAVPLMVIAVCVLLFMAVSFAARRDWIGLPSGFYIASRTLGLMTTVISILTIILTCFHISGEFALGTVKAAWVRPVSRSEWFIGKLLTALFAAALLYVISVLVVSLLAWVIYGFSDLMEKDYMVHSAVSLTRRYLLVISLDLWAVLALTSVSAMLASLINRPGGAISVAIILSLIFAVLGMFQVFEPFLLNTCLAQPFDQFDHMAKGLPLRFGWGTLAWRGLACSSAWMALGTAFGIFVTRKKEITF